MAMTRNQLDIIDTITKNNMPAARRAAMAAIVEDTSKKNAYDCARYKRLLDPTLNPELLSLPRHVESILEAEEPSESFLVMRYYLSPREAELFNHISRMRTVCDMLAEKRIRYPNTTLLYGVSGTGKTTFGRYVAALFELPFYYLNFSKTIDSHLGATSKNISAAFSFARTTPCVFMLDEIDTVCARRGNGDSGSDREFGNITVTLMQEFDKLTGDQIVIGATNRIDYIDEAMIRRFSKLHEVLPPCEPAEAARIVRVLLDDTKTEYNLDEVFEFCEENFGHPQYWYISQTIEALARTIEQDSAFSFNHERKDK